MQNRGYHIHLNGITQGVGYRPWVLRMARDRGLSGRTWNAADGLHIDLIAPPEVAHSFYRDLQNNLPPGAMLTEHSLTERTVAPAHSFTIRPSPEDAEADALLPPDVAMCMDCRRELHDPSNRRYGFPFITCTYCGPRYSIIHRLPYDRERTTMRPFQQCPDCRQEYGDPTDRRFHSQTNSCSACGPRMWMSGAPEGKEYEPREIVSQAISLLEGGSILAIKGTGGYLLVCDATDAATVQRLRDRKQRPGKPFALLFPNLEKIRAYAEVSAIAAETLNGPIRPITLLPLKQEPAADLAVEAIAPGLAEIGVMLPGNPLLDLISTSVDRPLVATSANLSGSPIRYRTETIEAELGNVADCFLHHDREILVPQDDSVLRFSTLRSRRVWLRRSRGLAPLYAPDCGRGEGESAILSTGGELKNSFALKHKNKVFVSAYLGDLADYESQETAAAVRNHLLEQYDVHPEVVVVDAHPAYHGRQIGQQISSLSASRLMTVQHHRAHFAAVLAEHQLLHTSQGILGVIWDGTGYGDDGNIWGGEFFRYEDGRMERLAHLANFPVLFGDKMSREPRLSALAIMGDHPAIRSLFTEDEWRLYGKASRVNSGVLTSSMGRLFDAVAALLLRWQKATFEGEAAMRLEAAARRAQQRYGWPTETPWPIDDRLDASAWLVAMANERANGRSVGELALAFHRQCVGVIEYLADKSACATIAFSGGCWQNTLLVDMVDHLLADRFDCRFHLHLSANDENISYGQLQFPTIGSLGPRAGSTLTHLSAS